MRRKTIIVEQDPARPSRGILSLDDRTFPCVLGRGGARRDKHEGDGATPIGRFEMRRVLYRSDRIAQPQTSLPVAAIGPGDGWCDAPDDAAYNRPVTLPYRARAESMMRADGLYDVVVVLGHNDSPVVPGAGSAIFIHVAAPDGEPTAGCIALSRDDLLAVLTAADADTVVEVRG